MTQNTTPWIAGLLLGAVVVPAVPAQAPRFSQDRNGGSVHRMEINNGLNRTVRYFGDNVSPGDALTLREMERLENETDYVQNLTALRQQYVVGERLAETNRRYVQCLLYGLESTASSYGELGGGYAYAGYAGALPYTYPRGAWRGWGYGYGYGAGLSGAIGGAASVTRSLEDGVGDEGTLKTALAPVIAQQATPEYAANLDRSYDRVVLRASASPTLRAALRLPSSDDALRERSHIRNVANESVPGNAILFTLRDGEKLRGSKVQEDGDWFIIQLVGGGTVKIRQSEVVRMDAGPGNKIRPAVND